MNRREFLSESMMGTAAAAMARLEFARSVRAQTARARLAADPRRPQYHLLPAANWMNDPNGPIFWNGQYHMFYQYNPDGAYWGNMHWGHAVSPDMVHWHHLPVALAPTPGGPDADGCFTGTAVVKDGSVAILYTGVRAVRLSEATIKDGNPPLRESQCLAVAEDPELRRWRKAPTPAIEAPPQGIEVNGFRDPSPWWQGAWWYTVLASGIAKEGGAVLLYRSRDLRQWEYVHVLSKRDAKAPGGPETFDASEVWECPEFFALQDRHILIFSTSGKTYWQSGKLDETSLRFEVEQAGTVDHGSFYAAKTQLDQAGNRIIWGWIPETRPLAEYKAAGWAGMMSLPRVLSLGPDGRLRMRAPAEVSRLRGTGRTLDTGASEERIHRQIETMRIAACCGEMRCVVRSDAGPFSLGLGSGPTGRAPWLTIGYDPNEPSRISIDSHPLALSGARNLEIQAHVDASVIELLINGEIAWTKRFYPEGNTARDLRLHWNGGTAAIASLEMWQYSPISADRLTT